MVDINNHLIDLLTSSCTPWSSMHRIIKLLSHLHVLWKCAALDQPELEPAKSSRIIRERCAVSHFFPNRKYCAIPACRLPHLFIRSLQSWNSRYANTFVLFCTVTYSVVFQRRCGFCDSLLELLRFCGMPYIWWLCDPGRRIDSFKDGTDKLSRCMLTPYILHSGRNNW